MNQFDTPRDDLTVSRLRAELHAQDPDASPPPTISLRSSSGSTNDDAKEAAALGASHGSVWIADEQTKGRGRAGNVWQSPPGLNIYLSILFRPEGLERMTDTAALTLAVGVAVARALRLEVPPKAPVQIKWPNDIYVREKKLAGILVEAVYRGSALSHVVVGVGCNVHQRIFPEELAQVATSVALSRTFPCIVGDAPDRSRIASRLIGQIHSAFHQFAAEGLTPFRRDLERLDALNGKLVEVHQGTELKRGTAQGFDDTGALLVEIEPGEVLAVRAGHVTLAT